MSIISEYSGAGAMGKLVNGTYGSLVHISDGAISELYMLLSDEKFRSRVTPDLVNGCRESTLNEFRAVLDERKLEVTNGVTYDVLEGIYEISSSIDWKNPAQVAELKGICDGYIASHGMSDEEVRRMVESLKGGSGATGAS